MTLLLGDARLLVGKIGLGLVALAAGAALSGREGLGAGALGARDPLRRGDGPLRAPPRRGARRRRLGGEPPAAHPRRDPAAHPHPLARHAADPRLPSGRRGGAGLLPPRRRRLRPRPGPAAPLRRAEPALPLRAARPVPQPGAGAPPPDLRLGHAGGGGARPGRGPAARALGGVAHQRAGAGRPSVAPARLLHPGSRGVLAGRRGADWAGRWRPGRSSGRTWSWPRSRSSPPARSPADAAAVLVAGPRRPFLDPEVAALRAYAGRGGHLGIFVEPESDAGLDPLLAALGVEAGNDMIVDPNPLSRLAGATPVMPVLQATTAHPVSEPLAEVGVVFPTARSLVALRGRPGPAGAARPHLGERLGRERRPLHLRGDGAARRGGEGGPHPARAGGAVARPRRPSPRAPRRGGRRLRLLLERLPPPARQPGPLPLHGELARRAGRPAHHPAARPGGVAHRAHRGAGPDAQVPGHRRGAGGAPARRRWRSGSPAGSAEA